MCFVHARTGGIDTPQYWINPPASRRIPVTDILNEHILPSGDTKVREFVKRYANKLIQLGRHTFALRGNDADEPMLANLIRASADRLGVRVAIREFGQDPNTQTTSIFGPDVRVLGGSGLYVNPPALLPSEHLYICGDSLSVHRTVRDLIEYGMLPSKITVLEDLLWAPAYWHGAAGVNTARATLSP